ncbi:hypothetical protein ECZC06_54890 [Escherichia coli]|nr:hypothetical protein ECZC06_54890 [Escherichia coli]
MSLRSEFVLFASIFSVVLFLKFHSDKPVRFYSKCLFCTFKQTIKISHDQKWVVHQLVEHVLFNEGADDFFVLNSTEREKQIVTCQPLDAGAEEQVVTFNTLREDLAA